MVTQATDVTVTCFSLLTLATQARALATLALSTHSLHLAGDAAERQPQLDAEHGGSRKPVLSVDGYRDGVGWLYPSLDKQPSWGGLLLIHISSHRAARGRFGYGAAAPDIRRLALDPTHRTLGVCFRGDGVSVSRRESARFGFGLRPADD